MALLSGIAAIASATSARFTAQVSGGGVVTNIHAAAHSEVLLKPAANLTLLPQTGVTAAFAESQLFLGMLLILLGFALHLLFVYRVREHSMAVATHDMYPRRTVFGAIESWYKEEIDKPLGS